MPPASSDLLPSGVGRVPAWWMECTPHYTLDVDDEEARQMAEDQMAFYYMQLAAADDAGIIGPDGKPKIGPDGNPMEWHGMGANWNLGRSSHGGISYVSFGGRTFKPGQAVIDPSLFGIRESDPNYQAYLTGAKLPPGYLEKMAELADGQNNAGNPYGILNNSKQTDYGRYGRQAENLGFKPSWAKKKLRPTSQGAAARKGMYDDSPNKFVDLNSQNRRILPKESAPDVLNFGATPAIQEEPHTVYQQKHLHQQQHYENSCADDQSSNVEVISTTISEIGPDGTKQKKRIVRKVRKVRPKRDAIQEEDYQLEMLRQKQAELALLQQQVAAREAEEQRLRALQAQKERLLEQKRLAAEQQLQRQQQAQRDGASEEQRLRDLQARKEALLEQQRQAAEEKRLRELQAQKDRLLEQRRLAAEQELQKQKQVEQEREAEERRLRELQEQKNRLLEQRRLAAEQELHKQKQIERERAAEEQRLRDLQAQKDRLLQQRRLAAEQELQRQSEAAEFAEKLRRLEELKELKRQQDLAEAAAVAARMQEEEEYDEETYVEEVTVEGTIEEEYYDEEYIEEEVVGEESMSDLQATLAMKQAELAKLQAM